MSGKCGVCGIEPLGRIIEGCGRNDCPFRQRKECRGCGEMYPLSEFRRHNKAKDGYGNYCHDCRLRRRYEAEKRRVGGELPPFEQWRRNIYRTGNGPWRVRINCTTRRLEELHFRNVIDDVQLRAGLKYRSAWENYGLLPKVISDYGERMGVGETSYGMPMTERQAHYRAVLREANAALGVFLQRVDEMLCVEDETFLGIARRCGRRGSRRAQERFGRRVVIEVLDVLVRHWGLKRNDKARTRTQSWTAEDAEEVRVRPDLWEG